jgi:hypothetical protein
MVCCVFQATNLVNIYRPRKSARTFVSKREASNKLYTVLYAVIYFVIELIISSLINSLTKNSQAILIFSFPLFSVLELITLM